MHKKTTLVRANIAFRDHDFSDALKLYKEALKEAEEPLKARICFNLKLAQHRLGIEYSADDLVKPRGMQRYYFDMIVQSGLFDPAWYSSQYNNKYNIGANPLEHYINNGVEFLTDPSLYFNTAYYLKSNQDVANSGMHPFIHFVTQGYKENRSPVPLPVDNALDDYIVEPPQYIPKLSQDAAPPKKAARVIAFYLPQYHPIPENDKWWGKGFTEWTNVRPAQPQFEGHYQPHVPDDFLGYYDLRETAVMHKQIELAKQYGVEGFCFYTYWFSGYRLLETPVDNYLEDPSLDLPFCICWANENWSRRWDGLDNDLLMVQNYSAEDDFAFISHMSKYLIDPRYIKVDGKPLLIIYRPNLFPSMIETAGRWRKWCRNNGLGEIYIAYVQSFEKNNPADYGLDAAIEFPPNNSSPPEITNQIVSNLKSFSGNVYDWRIFIKRSEDFQKQNYTLYRGACPSWDNTARKKNRATLFVNSSPLLFEKWLTRTFINYVNEFAEPENSLLFVNAWNEWAEGAHLEPDKRYGYAWLNSVRNAHDNYNKITSYKIGILIHVFYIDVFINICSKLSGWNILKNVKLIITTTCENEANVNSILKSQSFDYTIYTNENKGRDVLPFVKCLDHGYLNDFDFIIKVHTKKSLHRNDGDSWREIIYESLLIESNVIESICKTIFDQSIGLVSPKGQCVPFDYYLGSNKDKIDKILKKNLGDEIPSYKDLKFIAGTMFLANKKFIHSLSNLKLSDEFFESEHGQVDGTTAHAIERVIGAWAYVNNFTISDDQSEEFIYAEKSVA